MASLEALKSSYCQANRCWQSNNLKACARICNSISRDLSNFDEQGAYRDQLAQLKNLVWFLKIKCLAEDYHLNESFLLNEEDIESEDQVNTYTATATNAARTTKRPGGRSTASQQQSSRQMIGGGSRMDTATQRTGILTGRMPTRTSSRRSGYTTTSYRPLTTSLTASQTAFSRSTRPLLKYSSCSFLSKCIYDYLYNTQKATNICPDYRQCLEYLNLVHNRRKKEVVNQNQAKNQTESLLIRLSNEHESIDEKKLGAYWSLAFGICYFNLKMHKEAEKFFAISSSADKKYLDPYLWLMKIYLRLNQPSMVLKTCEDGLTNNRNAILHNWKARVESLQGKSLAAHMSLRESLQYCPTNIEALANVGHYSFYGDKFELALKCFERINQLSMNTGTSAPQAGGPDGLLSSLTTDSSAELFNNMALCNFQCGNYAVVMPLFHRAFLNSPNKEVTSNIWYNISFVPLSFGARELAISCLRLALKSDSQNHDAANNLGVLKYEHLINDPLHYKNRQEYWSLSSTRSTTKTEPLELTNSQDQRPLNAQLDAAETLFGLTNIKKQSESPGDPSSDSFIQPEMLYNIALLKRQRGQMIDCVKYCDLYLQYDQNNHTIRDILCEINELISHDS